MKPGKLLQGGLWLALGLALTTATALAQSATQQPQTKAAAQTNPPPANSGPALEPRALAILKASSERLAAAHTLMFTAVESYESPSRQGHPLVYVTKSDVTLQRPDKLRVIMPGDGPASEFYYNGKTMTAFAPAENLVAVTDAPATIDAALDAAYQSAAIYFPFTDVIVTDPYQDMLPGITLAYYMGQSRVVGETTTDMVAYIDNGVFIQTWIGADDKLPRLIHAVYLDDPLQLRHNLLFSNWQLDVPVPAGAFAPSDTASAKRINFAHPHPQPAPGAKPAMQGAPAKSQ